MLRARWDERSQSHPRSRASSVSVTCTNTPSLNHISVLVLQSTIHIFTSSLLARITDQLCLSVEFNLLLLHQPLPLQFSPSAFPLFRHRKPILHFSTPPSDPESVPVGPCCGFPANQTLDSTVSPPLQLAAFHFHLRPILLHLDLLHRSSTHPHSSSSHPSRLQL